MRMDLVIHQDDVKLCIQTDGGQNILAGAASSK